MIETEEGIRRVTFSLPLGIDHVHCYFLRASSGGWILVDTSLGSRTPAERWGPVLEQLDAPVERIVVTHMHPDHVGGARDVAELTGAPVFQGRDDYEQCVRAWGEYDPQRFIGYWLSHGVPGTEAEAHLAESVRLVDAVHWVRDPELLEDGDEIDGWRVEVLRGHADGHIVLIRAGVMIADYFVTLARIEELAPRVAYAGHKDPVADPRKRAREIRAHHEERLARTVAALDGRPKKAYEVSLALFPGDLSPSLRRFATAESLAHLERLVRDGRAGREETGYLRA